MGDVDVLIHKRFHHRFDFLHKLFGHILALLDLCELRFPFSGHSRRFKLFGHGRNEAAALFSGDQVLGFTAGPPGQENLSVPAFRWWPPGWQASRCPGARLLPAYLLFQQSPSRPAGVSSVKCLGGVVRPSFSSASRTGSVSLSCTSVRTSKFSLIFSAAIAKDNPLDGFPAIVQNCLAFGCEGLSGTLDLHCGFQRSDTARPRRPAIGQRSGGEYWPRQQAKKKGSAPATLCVGRMAWWSLTFWLLMTCFAWTGMAPRKPNATAVSMTRPGKTRRHVLGKVAAVGAGIGDELLLIERLGVIEGLLCRKSQQPVGIPLEGGQVIESRWALGSLSARSLFCTRAPAAFSGILPEVPRLWLSL